MTSTRVGCRRARLVHAQSDSRWQTRAYQKQQHQDNYYQHHQHRRSCASTNILTSAMSSHFARASSMSRVILLVTVAVVVCGGLAQATHGTTSASFEATGPNSNQVYKSSGDSPSKPTHDMSPKRPVSHTEIQSAPNQTEQTNSASLHRRPGVTTDSTNSAPKPKEITLRDVTTPSTAPTTSRSSSTTTETSSSTTTPSSSAPTANVTAASRRANPQQGSEPRMGGAAAGDLAVSSSSLSNSLVGRGSLAEANTKQAQPKRSSSSAASGNRWTHFGARLRPLAGAVAGQPTDHQLNHEAAASTGSKAMATLAKGGANHHHLQQQQGRPQLASRHQLGQQLQGNSLGAVSTRESASDQEADNDDDDDDLDSEALLYKMMQQQSFLMNPNFQDQQVVASMPLEPSQQQQQQVANGQQQQQQAPSMVNQQQQHDDNMAKSKRVIKLLKSYSHIHQVDDSDDQIRGSYGRYQRPSQGSNQYQAQQQQQQSRPINKNGQRQQQHIFISSRPVTTSQTRQQARVYAGEDDGQYRPSGQAGHQPRQSIGDEPNGGGQDATEDQNGQNSPAEEEDDFECPNNGIFADTASGCQAYHVCQSASQVQQRFQCPLGTLFNDIILTCDFAHNVQCGKKPGELGSAAVPSVHQQQQQQGNQVERQVPQQHQHHGQPARQQSGTGSGQSFARPQQMQHSQQQHRATSPGPRQLVIGSPYNLHNQQRPAQSQAQALAAYPSVKPLSNSLATSNNDEEDDADADEKLVPATLPPRASPVLPFQAPPQLQATTPSLPATSSSRPVNKLTYQQHPQAASRPAQLPQQQRPRYQPAVEASTPASNYGASAAPPTFVEPNQQQQSPERTASSATSPAGSQPDDMQSYSLVINHMAPAKKPSGRPRQELATTVASTNYGPQQQQQQQQQGQTEQRPTTQSKHFGQFASSHKPGDIPDQSVQNGQQQPFNSGSYQTVTQQQQHPRVQSSPKLQQQAVTNGNTNLQPTRQGVVAHNHQQHIKQKGQSTATNRQESPTSNVASHALAPSNQRYESRREPARLQNRYRQPAAQLPRVTPTTPSYAEATPAASQPAVSHRQHGGTLTTASKIDGSSDFQDVTRQQQQQQTHRLLQDSPDGVLNDGVFLIIRHSSSSPPLQVGDGNSATNIAASLANPTATQLHSADRQQASAAASPKVAQVYGLLPPMDPPAPQPHDHHYKQQEAVQQQQQHQYNGSDQLVSSASSAPASAEPASTKPPAPTSGQQTTTTSQSSSPVRTPKSQTSSKNTVQQHHHQQQATRVRRAKRIKPATTPSKAQRNSSTTTSATTNATTSTTTGGNNVGAKNNQSNTNTNTNARQQPDQNSN